MLFYTLAHPPKTNVKAQKKKANGWITWTKTTTLYRGLGLPEKAIQVYHGYRKSGKKFYFTGFTSTSLDKEKALQFAYQAKQRGQVPVLFVMEIDHMDGSFKASLNDKSLSAFPDEKEYLIGFVRWKVKKIKEEILKFRGEPFKVIQIKMKGGREGKWSWNLF